MQSHWVVCIRSSLWMVSYITFAGLVAGSLSGQDEPREISDGSRERLVLLKSGRVMSGRVIRNAVGYLIDQNQGQIQLPVEDVKFIVDTLRDGYYKQRDSIVEPTPATHLALANWCMSFGLQEEANDELRRCLRADPENMEARRLLKRLTESIRASLPPTPEGPAPRKTSEGFLQQQVESIGGLSRESALQFKTRIQPLLLKKCGNAHCHGTAATNDFHVVSSRVSGHGARQSAERNLAQTLRQIDFDDVEKSKLLSGLQGTHGGKKAIFTGQIAGEQILTLQTWVETVVEEKQSENEALEQQPRLISRTPSRKLTRPLTAKNDQRDDSRIVQVSISDDETEPSLPNTEESTPRKSKPDPTDAAALAREPEDAFDPEQFNQRFRR